MRVASLVNNHVVYASIFVDSRVSIGVCGCEISLDVVERPLI